MQNQQGLNYILEISREGSISKAAEKLGISQPALSAYVKKIEEHLAMPIFDRSKKPLCFTEAGQIYLEYSKRQLDLDKELEDRLSDLKDLKWGSLVIGGASFFNISYLPRAIAEFFRLYPDIEVSVIDGNLPDLTQRALQRDLDLFVAPSWNMDPRCCYESLFSEQVLVCVPPQWEINRELAAFQIPVETILLGEIRQWQDSGQGTCVDFKRFCKEPFVLLRNEQHIGHMMSQLFQRYAFEPMHSITVEQTMTSYGLTLAGAGISLMTESTIRHSHFKDYPTFYLADPELCQRDMYVAYPKQRYLSRAAKEFIAILKTSLQKF